MSPPDTRRTRRHVADTLRRELVHYDPDTQLPGVNELRNRFQVSTSTVVAGMAILIAEGLVVSAGGRGGGYFTASEPLPDAKSAALHRVARSLDESTQALRGLAGTLSETAPLLDVLHGPLTTALEHYPLSPRELPEGPYGVVGSVILAPVQVLSLTAKAEGTVLEATVTATGFPLAPRSTESNGGSDDEDAQQYTPQEWPYLAKIAVPTIILTEGRLTVDVIENVALDPYPIEP